MLIINKKSFVTTLLFLSSTIILVSLLLPFFSTLDRLIRLSLIFLSLILQFYCFIKLFLYSKNTNNNLGIFVHVTIFFFLFLLLSFLLFYTQWSTYMSFFEKTYNYLLFITPLFIVANIYLLKNSKLNSYLLFLISFIYIFTIFTSFLGLLEFPTASRDLASYQNFLFYSQRNIGGYGFFYSLPFFGLILINLSKNKILNFLIWFSILLCIVLSQYFILLMIFLLTFFIRVKTIKFNLFLFRLMVFFGSFIIFIIIFNNSFINLLKFLIDLTDFLNLSFLSEKISDFVNLLLTNQGGNSIDSRLYVYIKSVISFLRNPFFGGLLEPNPIGSVGGHSEILDLLGSTGIFGLIILILMIKILHPFKVFLNNEYIYYSTFILILIALLNPISSFPQISIMFLILPILYNNKHETKNSLDY